MRNRIPREVLQEIQDRSSLVNVVSRYVTLRRRGRQHIGLCPFHSEKSPSFHVDEEKGLYYCFGCQEGGDVFKFLSRMENRSFPEVVRDLAGQAGITLPEPELSPEEERKSRQRDALYRIHDVAARYFEAQLDGPEGGDAIAYLKRRGLTPEVAHRFRVGLAPEGWQGLVDHLGDDRHALANAQAAGLVIEGQRQKPYDRFRGRVIFPITDPSGRIIAFGGRTLGSEPPKYLNSPESAIFVKSDALYGLSEARRAIAHQDAVLIVEGYFDVLTLVVHGVENVVATCGTSLTRGHLRLLRRYTRNVILMYDGDAAGQRAAERSLELFLDEDMWPLYLSLPEGRDPDEVVRDEGGEGFRLRLQTWGNVLDHPRAYSVSSGDEMRSRMASCKPLLDHIIIERCREAVRTSVGTADLVGELAPLIARLRASQRGFYLNLVSEHTGIQPSLIEEQLSRYQRQGGRDEREAPGRAQAQLRIDLPPEEEQLVQLLVQHGDVAAARAEAWGVVSQMTHPGLRDLAQRAITAQLSEGRVEPAALLEGVEPEELHRRVAGLFMRELKSSDGIGERDIESIFMRVRLANLGLQLKSTQERIARLSHAAGDPTELLELTQLKLSLSREKSQLEKRMRQGAVATSGREAGESGAQLARGGAQE